MIKFLGFVFLLTFQPCFGGNKDQNLASLQRAIKKTDELVRTRLPIKTALRTKSTPLSSLVIRKVGSITREENCFATNASIVYCDAKINNVEFTATSNDGEKFTEKGTIQLLIRGIFRDDQPGTGLLIFDPEGLTWNTGYKLEKDTLSLTFLQKIQQKNGSERVALEAVAEAIVDSLISEEVRDQVIDAITKQS